jgi:hypothetical protein
MSTSTTPTFIPSREEVINPGRDLRFHPSTTEHPTALTLEQVAAFNRDGTYPEFASSMKKRLLVSGITLMNS